MMKRRGSTKRGGTTDTMSITTTTTSGFSNTKEGRPLNQLMLQMAGMGTAHHVSALASITRADIGQRFAEARLAVFMELPTLQGKQEILEQQQRELAASVRADAQVPGRPHLH